MVSIGSLSWNFDLLRWSCCTCGTQFSACLNLHLQNNEMKYTNLQFWPHRKSLLLNIFLVLLLMVSLLRTSPTLWDTDKLEKVEFQMTLSLDIMMSVSSVILGPLKWFFQQIKNFVHDKERKPEQTTSVYLLTDSGTKLLDDLLEKVVDIIAKNDKCKGLDNELPPGCSITEDCFRLTCGKRVDNKDISLTMKFNRCACLLYLRFQFSFESCILCFIIVKSLKNSSHRYRLSKDVRIVGSAGGFLDFLRINFLLTTYVDICRCLP